MITYLLNDNTGGVNGVTHNNEIRNAVLDECRVNEDYIPPTQPISSSTVAQFSENNNYYLNSEEFLRNPATTNVQMKHSTTTTMTVAADGDTFYSSQDQQHNHLQQKQQQRFNSKLQKQPFHLVNSGLPNISENGNDDDDGNNEVSTHIELDNNSFGNYQQQKVNQNQQHCRQHSNISMNSINSLNSANVLTSDVSAYNFVDLGSQHQQFNIIENPCNRRLQQSTHNYNQQQTKQNKDYNYELSSSAVLNANYAPLKISINEAGKNKHCEEIVAGNTTNIYPISMQHVISANNYLNSSNCHSPGHAPLPTSSRQPQQSIENNSNYPLHRNVPPTSLSPLLTHKLINDNHHHHHRNNFNNSNYNDCCESEPLLHAASSQVKVSDNVDNSKDIDIDIDEPKPSTIPVHTNFNIAVTKIMDKDEYLL